MNEKEPLAAALARISRDNQNLNPGIPITAGELWDRAHYPPDKKPTPDKSYLRRGTGKPGRRRA